MLVGSTAFGQEGYELGDASIEQVSYLGGGGGCDDDCGKGGCGILDGLGCGIGGGLYFDAELLFFKPDLGIPAMATAGPVVVPPTFNYEAAPRISLGYVGCGGLGVRLRYFDFSHDTGGLGPNVNRSILVDLYTLDAELFEELEIGCATTMEWSVGVRYIDGKGRDAIGNLGAVPVNAQERQFSGWGLNFGLKFERCVGPGNFYGRARWAIEEDERSTAINWIGNPANVVQRTELFDDKIMQTEIAIGYEMSRCTGFGVITGRIGYEIQYWEGLGSFGAGAGNLFDGFDGLVLGLELAR
jgi:hypothetical protein